MLNATSTHFSHMYWASRANVQVILLNAHTLFIPFLYHNLKPR